MLHTSLVQNHVITLYKEINFRSSCHDSYRSAEDISIPSIHILVVKSLVKLAIIMIMLSQLFLQTFFHVGFRKRLKSRDGGDELRSKKPGILNSVILESCGVLPLQVQH